jgi:hypothetical protein
VLRAVGENRILDEYRPEGAFDRTHRLSDYNDGLLAVDAQDRLLLPSASDQVVKILSPTGEVLRRIDLREVMVPVTVADAGAGQVWVGGGAVLPLPTRQPRGISDAGHLA